MPWDIRRNYGSCSGYAVVKESDGSIAGCHETREKAARQIAALEASEAGKSVQPEFEKYRGELYGQLTEEEKAFHDALVAIANQYGPFDLGTSSIWVGYESGEDNEDAEIGVKCANCSFFNPENNGCAILSYQVEPMGKCRLAAIPDGLVMPEMEDEEDDETDDMIEDMNKRYTGCGCPTCKEMDVACKDCPVCNPGMSKAGSVRVGQMVSWGSSGGTARGKVKRIIRDGSYNVPDSDFTITGTPDNPAVVIEVYRDDKPTGRMVGHRMDSLRASKSIWSSFDPRQAVTARPLIDLFKRDYNTESRRRMAASGQAMPDGSFPIANRADLRNAIQSVGRASNYEAAKRHIMRRARALGATDMLPDDWK